MVSGIAEGSVTNYFGVTLKLVWFKNKKKTTTKKSIISTFIECHLCIKSC